MAIVTGCLRCRMPPSVALSLQKPSWTATVDETRLGKSLEIMAAIGLQNDGSVKRLAFSDEDLQARSLFIDWLKAAGASVRIDPAGNLIGRIEGSEPGLPALVTGSHLDTVPTGGRFDGALGVLAGLEVMRSLKDQAISLRHPLEVVVFADEESTMVGCKGMTGVASANPADYTCSNGNSITNNLPVIEGSWDHLPEARRCDTDIAAFLELHVEQGGILENRGDAIGLVEGVVGQRRFLVRVEGMANHAGTTPMDARQDALATAAQVILAVQDLAANYPGEPVGTVGKLQLWPNAANVVPGQVEMSIDLRDLSIEVLNDLVEELEARLNSISRASGCPISLMPQFSVDPTPAHLSVTEAIAASTQTLGLSCSALPSRASHDSQEMGRRWPMGMIFVPSRGGFSHSAAEFTSERQCADGTAVLMQSLVRLDQRLNRVRG